MKIFTKTAMILALIATGAHANPNDDDNSNSKAPRAMQQVFGSDTMPTDVFKEVLAYLSPNDIYSLSRAGKFQFNKDDPNSTLSGYLRIPTQRKAMEEIMRVLDASFKPDLEEYLKQNILNICLKNLSRQKAISSDTPQGQRRGEIFKLFFEPVPEEYMNPIHVAKLMPLCQPSVPDPVRPDVFKNNQIILDLMQNRSFISQYIQPKNLMEVYGYLLPFMRLNIFCTPINNLNIIQSNAIKNGWEYGIFNVFKKSNKILKNIEKHNKEKPDKAIKLDEHDGLTIPYMLCMTSYDLVNNTSSEKLTDAIIGFWNYKRPSTDLLVKFKEEIEKNNSNKN